MNYQLLLKYGIYIAVAFIVVKAIVPLTLLAGCFILLKENDKGVFQAMFEALGDEALTKEIKPTIDKFNQILDSVEKSTEEQEDDDWVQVTDDETEGFRPSVVEAYLEAGNYDSVIYHCDLNPVIIRAVSACYPQHKAGLEECWGQTLVAKKLN